MAAPAGRGPGARRRPRPVEALALVDGPGRSRPIRRGNFNKLSGWPHAVEALGTPGLHFHDLRHTGNQFAANSGAGLRDLMARMGHDSERAAMIYQNFRELHQTGDGRGDLRRLAA
jgi:integrase